MTTLDSLEQHRGDGHSTTDHLGVAHATRASSRGAFGPARIIALASLGLPRVVLHDLGVTEEADVVNLVLVIAPLVVWIAAAVARRVARPVRALLWVGLTYGALLAVTHQTLWDRAYGDDPPCLGGNLRGDLPESVEEILMRGFAVVSGVATGLLVGVMCGVVAVAALRRWKPQPQEGKGGDR